MNAKTLRTLRTVLLVWPPVAAAVCLFDHQMFDIGMVWLGATVGAWSVAYVAWQARRSGAS